MDVGGYQILNLSHFNFTGSGAGKIILKVNDDGGPDVVRNLRNVLAAAGKLPIPVLFSGLNIKITGGSPVVINKASIMGYHFTEDGKKILYRVLTHAGEFTLYLGTEEIPVIHAEFNLR